MKLLKNLSLLAYLLFMAACTEQDELATITGDVLESATAIDLAQTSGQLVSGTSFTIGGNSFQTGMITGRISETSETAQSPGGLKESEKGKGGHKGIMDGLNLLAPNDEILAIVEAESAGDIRGFRMYKLGGATITHYDASGKIVELPVATTIDGPQGGHSGNQFPEMDSLLSLIVKSKVDFGTGVTVSKNNQDITRKGVIMVSRTKVGIVLTEKVEFQNYVVNGIQISGLKTIVSEFDKATGKGSVKSTVANGKFIFVGGETGVWTSEKDRKSEVVKGNDSRKPISGKIITNAKTAIKTASGTVIYAHQTLTPLEVDLSCSGKRRGPTLGKFETDYRTNKITVNFGDGSCTNQTITITVNGVTTTKTIGG